MTEMVDRNLPDPEFTLARLEALKDWERGRKRRQKEINYAYDPLRRSRRLVMRDTDRALNPEAIAQVRSKLTRAREMLQSTRTAPRPHTEPSMTTSTPRPLHPGLAYLDTATRAMYQMLDPDTDLATTPDDALRTAWKTRAPGMSDELIDKVLADINGTRSGTT